MKYARGQYVDSFCWWVTPVCLQCRISPDDPRSIISENEIYYRRSLCDRCGRYESCQTMRVEFLCHISYILFLMGSLKGHILKPYIIQDGICRSLSF